MKSIQVLALTIVLSVITITKMNAQVDRSQPKPGPAPQITIATPIQFELSNGLQVVLVENHKLPRVTINLTIDNQPVAEGDIMGVDDLVGSMMGNATQKTSKEAFIEEIDYLGADIDFHSSGALARCLSKYSDRVLELFAEGTLSPVFVQEELDKEKAKYIESLKASEKNVKVIADRVQNALVYGKSHPFGEFVTEDKLNRITLENIQNHYGAFFVPENAYLVVVGDIDVKAIKKQIKQLFGDWTKQKAPASNYTDPVNVTTSEVNIIDVPHAVQSEVALINSVDLTMSSPDYFPTLLANQILGGGGEGRLFLNLREKHGWTYGSYSSLRASKYVSKFKASASVRTTVTDSAVVEIFNELKLIRTDLVSAEDLKNAKAKYIGNFVMGIEKPETVARYALNIKAQDLSEDFYKNFIKNIEAVTPEQILKVAQKYFMADQIRVIVAGKSEDITAGLSKLDMPVRQYDAYGNLIEN